MGDGEIVDSPGARRIYVLPPHPGGGAGAGDVAVLDAAQTRAAVDGGQHEDIGQDQDES